MIAKESAVRNSRESFVVYIDESGDEGFNISDDPAEKKSSRWLVIGAVVFRADTESSDVNIIEHARRRVNRPHNRPLHFQKLKENCRRAYANEIAKGEFKCTAVMIHKPDLSGRTYLREKHKLYFYATKLLAERVSWCCAEWSQSHSSSNSSSVAKLVFSDRRTMPYSDLRDYFRPECYT